MQTVPIYGHFAVPFFASCDAFETFSDWTLWRIFPCYFSKALPYWRRQKMNSNIQKIDILCNVTKKKFARHFENHRCMTWRHTGSDQWTNVYPRDGSSLLNPSYFPNGSFGEKSCVTTPNVLYLGSVEHPTRFELVYFKYCTSMVVSLLDTISGKQCLGSWG